MVSARRSACTGENGEERRAFLEGINRDAPGLGRGGGLDLFFGRGSCGGTGKPFGFETCCPLVCGRGASFSVVVSDAMAVAVPFVPCSESELVEASRLTCGFVISFGLISSGI